MDQNTPQVLDPISTMHHRYVDLEHDINQVRDLFQDVKFDEECKEDFKIFQLSDYDGDPENSEVDKWIWTLYDNILSQYMEPNVGRVISLFPSKYAKSLEKLWKMTKQKMESEKDIRILNKMSAGIISSAAGAFGFQTFNAGKFESNGDSIRIDFLNNKKMRDLNLYWSLINQVMIRVVTSNLLYEHILRCPIMDDGFKAEDRKQGSQDKFTGIDDILKELEE